MSVKDRNIHRIDASGRILGRLATEIALKLRGKNRLGFTPYQDHGDAVVISNASKIAVTGNKLNDKIYYTHSTYSGALKSKPLKELLVTRPEQVITLAVRRMLPANRLRQHWMKRLTFTNDA